MIRLHLYMGIAVVMLIYACGQSETNLPVIAQRSNTYHVKTDIRFGRNFYSVYLSNNGYGYVVKGKGSPYTEPFLRIDTAQMSKVFKLDSVNAVNNALQTLQKNPQRLTASNTDSAHVEIYYNGKKIYDDYTMSVKFWMVFRPMLTNLPEGFNPFQTRPGNNYYTPGAKIMQC